MSDVVETNPNRKSFNVLENSKNCNNAQEQEVNDLSEFLKLEYNKYQQYKIIYDTLEDCVSINSDVDKSLKIRIKEILLSENVAQTLTLEDNVIDESNDSVLGTPCVSDLELNYTQRNQLQDILKLKLDQKYKDICNGFYKITDSDINMMKHFLDTVPIQLSSEDKILIDYKNKLIFEQEQYVKNLLNLLELLKEITNLRLKKLPQITEQKIKECQIEEKTNHLKSLLAQEKVRVDVFMETSNSLKAYKELIKDIKDQQQECQKEIQHLNELKEKYNRVSSKQFDDILKSYLQYKCSIEKKKLLYDCLKS